MRHICLWLFKNAERSASMLSTCRGDLVMAHCHPLLMVQSIHRPPDDQFATQSHSPHVLLVMARLQQHPNSQQQGKSLIQFLAALVLTPDNVFVGEDIGCQVSERLSVLYCLSWS